MNDLWNLDMQNAKTLIRDANEHATLYTSQMDKNEKRKYIPVIRAKVTSLKKTVNSLESMIRGIDTENMDPEILSSRRRDLDDTVCALKSLELLLRNSSSSEFPSTSYYDLPRDNEDLNTFSNSELVDYRDTMIKMQDDELDLLDTNASAIKNISSSIRDEVNLHTRLLGEVNTSMDVTQSLVTRNRERFNEVIRKSSKKFLMFIIVLLVVILLLVSLLL
ncbi:conserved hypothetical protein [Theileria equi strain WA]|uniref:t-SNARE coiled-coil homology domain-containing protein n=1 Tax=Theileria equi strain WA TaxID=1537102 RepID=L1LE72_THEEQ|nr:conserved hypothetical protein [Theileria equi strain WA]EKX73727.1 conserved hypothetical protein [Theileria equi strain WA]|eukprot:XP_004833179.1 conserved hypothetical protein [Theileria equi strain WA]